MNVKQFPQLKKYLEGADHDDVKTVEGALTMREFIARFLLYNPGWVKFLFAVRGVVAKILGLDHAAGETPPLTADTLPITPGEDAAFFTVVDSDGESYWIAGIEDDHLDAHVAVIVEPLDGGISRFHTVTIVHYNNRIGTLYFNLIRPFHHLIVWRLAKWAVRTPAPAG
jgi:hypothetical protein